MFTTATHINFHYKHIHHNFQSVYKYIIIYKSVTQHVHVLSGDRWIWMFGAKESKEKKMNNLSAFFIISHELNLTTEWWAVQFLYAESNVLNSNHNKFICITQIVTLQLWALILHTEPFSTFLNSFSSLEFKLYHWREINQSPKFNVNCFLFIYLCLL